MFNRSDITRNQCQLFGGQAKLGYDWWWHSFTAIDSETGEGARQIHNFYGWEKIDVDMGVPFSIKAGECFLTENKTWGKDFTSPFHLTILQVSSLEKNLKTACLI